MLETLIVHDQHDQVHALEADLKSGAPAADGDECGCAPTLSSTARSYATAVLATKHKSAFDHVRHDDDAFGIVQLLPGSLCQASP